MTVLQILRHRNIDRKIGGINGHAELAGPLAVGKSCRSRITYYRADRFLARAKVQSLHDRRLPKSNDSSDEEVRTVT